MGKPVVIYNGTCPVCSREIAIYEARAQGLCFVDLTKGEMDAIGLTADQAARRLHVLRDGELIAGVEAFRVLWRGTRGFSWLAVLVGMPVVRQIAEFVYEKLLAPRLYRAHLRRQGLE